MTQVQYELGPQRRLLMRFESLQSDAGEVLIDDENRMFVEITPLEDQDLETIRAETQLCPLTEDWMMLATWRLAHFAKVWDQVGGSHIDSECIEVTPTSGELDAQKIYFDVSDWYLHYSQSREHNFGWVLIPLFHFSVYGDNHINKALRLRWKKIMKEGP